MDNPAGQRAANAMQKHNLDLVSAVKLIVPEMREALLGKGLLTDDVKSKASLPIHSEFEKASIIVDCVRTIVKTSPEKIYTFIAILRKLHSDKEKCPVADLIEEGR